MSFRDNLLHLRATRNMTQEHLAMLVGVSRQSVAKWEAERSYPEMDKLIKLCEIFDCSLDELVRGDLTERASEPQLAVTTEALATDVVGYDEHQRSFARRMGLGVALVISATACAAFLDGVAGESAQAIALFGGIAMGLALIIPTALGHGAFMREHPYVVNFYTAEERLAASRRFGVQLVTGIALIFGGVVVGSFGGGAMSETVAGGTLLLLVALGAGLIVYAALMQARVNVEEYNISALEELSEEEIAGIVGADRAPEVLAKVRRSKLIGAVCGIIMLVATAIALPLMFWADGTDQAFWRSFFWIPWMVGGLCCAIASIAISMRK